MSEPVLKLLRTDLPAQHRRPVQDAVLLLYKSIVLSEDKKATKEQKWKGFAGALQGSLDKSLGPQWHVLLGTSLGFACKYRKQSVAIWRIDQVMIVIWRSPGTEGPQAPEAQLTESASPQPLMLKVLSPEEIEPESELERVLAALKDELPRLSDSDSQMLAQTSRRRLHADFGPIWHVIAGQEFAIEMAEDKRNLLTVTIGKMRLVCFQHEQFSQQLISLDGRQVVNMLPYLILLLLGIIYLGLTFVCKEPSDSRPVTALQRRLCVDGWQQTLGTTAVFVMGTSFVLRKGYALLNRRKKD